MNEDKKKSIEFDRLIKDIKISNSKTEKVLNQFKEWAKADGYLNENGTLNKNWISLNENK